MSGVRDSCSKNASNCSCRGKRMIRSDIVRAWPATVRVALEHRGCVFHHRSCLAAKKKKTREAIVVRIRLRYAKKQIWSATQPHACSKLCWRMCCANFVEIISESPLLLLSLQAKQFANSPIVRPACVFI